MLLTGLPLQNLSFSDNFEGSVDLWKSEGNHNSWEHGIPQKPLINHAKSGLDAWITNLNYAYALNDSAYLYSPYFNFNGVTGAKLTFWHWFETGSGFDLCRVQYSTNFGQSWSSLGLLNDTLATNWYNTNVNGKHAWSGSSSDWIKSTYKLKQFDNLTNPVQFRFQFVSLGSLGSDGWAIDDFEILIPPAAIDGTIDSILSPKYSMSLGSTDIVKVRLKNNGTSTLTTIPVNYNINNGSSVSANWTGSLSPGTSVIYSFPSSMVAPSGNSFKLCAWVNVAGDNQNYNDTLCEIIQISSPHLDAGVSQIVSPLLDTALVGTSETVIVKIKNFGIDTLTSMNVQYQLSVANPVIETWSGNLKPGDSTLFTFTQKLNRANGTYPFCAKTLLTNDAVSSNDKSCKTLTAYVGHSEIWKYNFNLEQNSPNPAIDNTTIRFEIPYEGKVTFRITDLPGKIIQSETFTKATGKQVVEVKTKDLTPGIYYYSIEFEGHTLTKKMVISN